VFAASVNGRAKQRPLAGNERSGVITPATREVALRFDLRADDEPPDRVCASLTGLTVRSISETEHLDVLLFIDNIFRFVQAGSEVSALLAACRAPWLSAKLEHRIGELQNALLPQSGSITRCKRLRAATTIRPAPAATFTHLDATTNLSRQIVEREFIPQSIRCQLFAHFDPLLSRRALLVLAA